MKHVKKTEMYATLVRVEDKIDRLLEIAEDGQKPTAKAKAQPKGTPDTPPKTKSLKSRKKG